MNEDKLKIAVFIDFDNIQIGVRSTLNRDFDLALVLEALKERGEVVTKIAYGNWKRAGELTRTLTQNAVLMVQRDLTPRGDKNGADINLALDALEMAINHSHINAFVIVGGDSDFIALVEKLKQYNKAVFVVGGRSFTSSVLQRNCREFLAYENLVDTASPSDRKRDDGARRREVFPLSRAVALVERGLKVLADREVQAQLGLLKSTLIQLDSTFNERDFGASSFRAFIQKMADAKLVSVRQQGNSYVVEPLEREPLDGANEPAATTPPEPEMGSSEARAETEAGDGRVEADAGYSAGYSTGYAPGYSNGAETEPAPEAVTELVGAGSERTAPYAPPAPPTATRPPEEALDLLQRVLTPLRGTNPRPLYLRNVKQLLRAESPSFDEQQYGFASIVDLLRAGQNQNWLRLQRDRRGALRVFIPPSPAAPGNTETGESPVGETAAPSTGTDPAASDASDAAPATPGPTLPLEGADERQPVLAAPPKRREEGDEDSQIAILGYYSGIHGEKTEEAELSLAAAVADSGGRKKRGPRKPKTEGGAAPRRRKPAAKR